ncbi:hypothetical protein GCM10009863_16630 [Streptomyces axinellae]|uniref:Pectate lyase n=1 Tax=Streptomyces axinellae TaxID=552788 RepID=A0ABP6C5Q7_9ACTN
MAAQDGAVPFSFFQSRSVLFSSHQFPSAPAPPVHPPRQRNREDGPSPPQEVLHHGIHCEGSCTLENVWWEDVGEDAATFRGGDIATYTVRSGGARGADDKVLQFNGGGTLKVSGFAVEDFGKLVRSCGDCSDQTDRHVELSDIEAKAPGKSLVGVNENYGGTAKLSRIRILGDKNKKIKPCVRFEGNSSGDEPEETGAGPDGRTCCLYKESDISYG